MEINKEDKVVERFWANCESCNKKISGTSEKMLIHNIKVHKAFCKGVKSNDRE